MGLIPGARLVNQGQVVQGRVSVKFKFRFESLKSKFSFIPFACNVMN